MKSATKTSVADTCSSCDAPMRGRQSSVCVWCARLQAVGDRIAKRVAADLKEAVKASEGKKSGVVWYRVEGAAERLHLKPAAFRRFLERLPEDRKPKTYWLGSRMRFRATDIDKLVESVSPADQQQVPLRVVRGGKR